MSRKRMRASARSIAERVLSTGKGERVGVMIGTSSRTALKTAKRAAAPANVASLGPSRGSDSLGPYEAVRWNATKAAIVETRPSPKVALSGDETTID